VIATNTALYAVLPVALIAGRCQSLIEGGSIDWAHWRLLYQLALCSLLLAATVVDFADYVIPDAITVTGALLGILGAFGISNLQMIPVWVDWNQWAPDVGPFIPGWIKQHHHWHGLAWSVTGLVVGGVLTWLARAVSQRMLGVEALGLGDVTLMAMIGSFVGWQPVICVFLIAPLCGVFVGVALQFTKGRRALPYGPCLAAATIVVLFTWRPIWERTRDLFGHWPTLVGMGLLVIGGMAVLLGIVRLYRSIPVGRRSGAQDEVSEAQPAPGKEPGAETPQE
jgi:leader peptidase (prepilin peptidase)/N-methyltransferase